MTETLAVPAENGQMMRPDDAALMERVITLGDLGQLTPAERVDYYFALCRSLKLNPLAKPFGYIVLDGKLTLYALKECADQLRRIHGVSVTNLQTQHDEDLYTVIATARMPDGRMDMDQGVVNIAGLRGAPLANAIMRATTKAKRRLTLSLVGLSIPDETELDTMPNARRVRVDETTGELLDAPALPSPSEWDLAAAEYARLRDEGKRRGIKLAPLLREMTLEDIRDMIDQGQAKLAAAIEQPAPPAEDMGQVCAECEKAVTPGQAAVSRRAFQKILCPEHQRAAKAAA